MSETHFNLKPKDTIMKTNQTIIIAMTAVLLLTLAGCQEPKGYLELKEPKKELSLLEQAKLQYKNQLISMTTLLQQEANFRKNEALLIDAKYEKSLALASLNLVLGKNIKEEKN